MSSRTLHEYGSIGPDIAWLAGKVEIGAGSKDNPATRVRSLGALAALEWLVNPDVRVERKTDGTDGAPATLTITTTGRREESPGQQIVVTRDPGGVLTITPEAPSLKDATVDALLSVAGELILMDLQRNSPAGNVGGGYGRVPSPGLMGGNSRY